jgi:hypothetical protein
MDSSSAELLPDAARAAGNIEVPARGAAAAVAAASAASAATLSIKRLACAAMKAMAGGEIGQF